MKNLVMILALVGLTACGGSGGGEGGASSTPALTQKTVENVNEIVTLGSVSASDMDTVLDVIVNNTQDGVGITSFSTSDPETLTTDLLDYMKNGGDLPSMNKGDRATLFATMASVLGYQTRTVTLLHDAANTLETHIVVEYYQHFEYYSAWITYDPDFNAYFEDSLGNRTGVLHHVSSDGSETARMCMNDVCQRSQFIIDGQAERLRHDYYDAAIVDGVLHINTSEFNMDRPFMNHNYQTILQIYPNAVTY